MTHDYISWVLGLQGWERAHCEDNYFAGEEDTIDNAVSDETIDGSKSVEVSVLTKDTACQTPPEWGKSEAAQEADEAAPDLPPARLVIFRRARRSPRQVRCSGRGTRTRNLTRRRASSG